MQYYKKYIDTLPDRQRENIEGYLRQKLAQGYIKSESDLQLVMESINPNGNPMTIFNEVVPNSSMRNTDYNGIMDSVLVDMESIFADSNITAYDIGNHEELSKSWVSDIQRAIGQLNRRVAEFKILSGNAGGHTTHGYNGVYNESFTETSYGIYKDCRIQAGSLILKPSSSIEYIKSTDIQRVTSTPYPPENHTAGIYISTPREFDIAANYNIGNRSMLKKGTTSPGYWMTSLLSDGDIKSTIDSTTYYGYVNVLRIFFTSAKAINTIELDPVGKYKLYIRKIRYRDHNEYDSDDSGWNDLTYTDDNDDTVLVHGESFSSMLLRFKDTPVSALEFTLNSTDYDVLRYHFSPDTIRSSILWDEITDEEYSEVVDRYQPHRYGNRANSSKTADQNSNRYMDRVVNDMTAQDGMDQMLSTIKAGLSISDMDLDTISPISNTTGNADSGIGDELIDVNKNEYIIGTYSITPQKNLYPASGIYESHDNTGYDTYEYAIQEIMLDATQHTPGLTSIQHSVILDNGEEYPIAPESTTIYRERMTSPISAGGTATFDITFYSAGTAILYEYVDGVKTTIGTFPPAGKTLSLTGMTRGHVYVVEYILDRINYNPSKINLPTILPSGQWMYTELLPADHRIPLPTAPYINYNKYDWGTSTWNYASGVAGYYSDPHVLAQDITNSMWTWPTNVNVIGSGTSDPVTNLALISSDRGSYIVSGVWPNTGWYRFIFTGTDTEFNEYSYAWDVYRIPASGEGMPMSGTITLDDTKLVPIGTPIGTGINENRYEPVELFIDGSKAEDMTNYLESSQDPLDDYTDNNQYQYYLFNDTLYTNINFAEVPYKRVSVRYRYLTSYVKLKSVLYTNVKEPHYYTPSVDDYQLSFLGA